MSRRHILIGFTSVAVAAALAIGGIGTYSWWRLATITTFGPEITPPSTVTAGGVDLIGVPKRTETFLVFSVGSEGIDSTDGARLGIGEGRASMADGLTDSIMLVIANPVTRRIGIVSIPRDTWLEERGHRVNESYNRYGLNAFISDVTDLTGLEVNHAISVNFAAFADLTDAVGGIDIELPLAVRDSKAKLDLPSGCVRLGGAEALAFVRSRNWQVYTNGSWRSNATSSDWGRIERQQAFLRLVLAKIVSPELPLRVPALVDVAGDNLTIDAGLTVSALLSWAKAFAGGVDEVAAATIPGRGFTTEGGASVIGVDPAAARTTVELILAKLGMVTTPTADPAVPRVSSSPRPETATTSPWKPDAGEGEGGLRFTSCG